MKSYVYLKLIYWAKVVDIDENVAKEAGVTNTFEIAFITFAILKIKQKDFCKLMSNNILVTWDACDIDDKVQENNKKYKDRVDEVIDFNQDQSLALKLFYLLGRSCIWTMCLKTRRRMFF